MIEIVKLPRPMQWLIYYTVIFVAALSIIALIAVYGDDLSCLIAGVVLKLMQIIGVILVIASMLAVFREAIGGQKKKADAISKVYASHYHEPQFISSTKSQINSSTDKSCTSIPKENDCKETSYSNNKQESFHNGDSIDGSPTKSK
jgi:hypothetical protein